MTISRLNSWFFALLLLLGQQAGLLHHLGHDFDQAARLVASADGGSAGHGQGNSDADSLCALCVGFGTGFTTAPNALRPTLAAPILAYARPLTDTRLHNPVALTGTPIRGPPAHFSA